MNAFAELTTAALRDYGVDQLPLYENALDEATDKVTPACGTAWYGEKYRELAGDPTWFANSLIANAAKEAEGSKLLWELGGRIGDPKISELIRKHAIDEGRHCLYYISMIKLIFPKVGKDSIDRLKTLSPGFSVNDYPEPAEKKTSSNNVLDELIQINIGEIRTRIQQLLMRPVAMAYAPASTREKVGQLLDTLGDDETRHVAYTSQLINKAAQEDRDFVFSTTIKRWLQFNELTMSEVESGTFDSH